VMRRNDWSYTAFVDIEGYAIGFHATTSIPSAPAIPNGQNYAMTFTNCKTGIYAEVVSNVGIMFARCTTVNCATGLAIGGGSSTNGALQLHTCTFGGSIDAISADPTCVARIMLQQCTITGGNVNIGGGTFAASDCDFNNKAPQIVLGANARGIITGNRFKNGVNIENNSLYTNAIDHTPLTLKKLPPFPTITQPTHKPSRQVLYLATAAPFNAKPDEMTVMNKVAAKIRELGMYTFVRWGYIFIAPPLIVNKEQIDEGLSIISKAVSIADELTS